MTTAIDIFHLNWGRTSIDQRWDQSHGADGRHAMEQVPVLPADCYDKVATIAIPAYEANHVPYTLDYAYRATQNIEAAWRPEAPCRSTSVGDLFFDGATWFRVASVGFDPVKEPA